VALSNYLVRSGLLAHSNGLAHSIWMVRYGSLVRSVLVVHFFSLACLRFLVLSMRMAQSLARSAIMVLSFFMV
jgi:hypothetical protein